MGGKKPKKNKTEKHLKVFSSNSLINIMRMKKVSINNSEHFAVNSTLFLKKWHYSISGESNTQPLKMILSLIIYLPKTVEVTVVYW